MDLNLYNKVNLSNTHNTNLKKDKKKTIKGKKKTIASIKGTEIELNDKKAHIKLEGKIKTITKTTKKKNEKK